MPGLELKRKEKIKFTARQFVKKEKETVKQLELIVRFKLGLRKDEQTVRVRVKEKREREGGGRRVKKVAPAGAPGRWGVRKPANR